MSIVKKICSYYKNVIERVHADKLFFARIDFSVSYALMQQVIIQLGQKNDTSDDNSFIHTAKQWDMIQRSTENPKEFVVLFLNYYFADRKLLPDMMHFVFNKEDIILCSVTEDIIKKELDIFVTALASELNVSYRLSADTAYLKHIEERIASAERFYLTEHGEWIEHFADTLGDDISVTSFKTFLRQRIHGHILWDTLALYPIAPPKVTQPWRNERLTNLPPMPHLTGAAEEWLRLVLIDTFALEQYAVPGLVEARQGDTVIDAGAYIGDTALYFAQKVGPRGQVFAFEAVPATVAAAEENLRNNPHDALVEIVPYALSDSEKTLMFNTDLWSTAYGASDKGTLPIHAITLDSFVEERKLHVDYIKADLEGSDIDLLLGARKTIHRDGPTCGLAVYHRQDHFIRIPQILAEERDDYVFYFRCEAEPVLLAITKERLSSK